MSSLSRRTATAGLLTLSLLGVPTAALAAGPDPVRPAQTERGQERATQAQDADRGRSDSAPSPSASPSLTADRAPAGAAGGAAAGRSAAAPGQARAEQARPASARPASEARAASAQSEAVRPESAGKGKATGKGKAAGAGKAEPAGAARTADPRGNNGTFKVDGPVLDTSHGNEPDVSCAFRLNFFGYDAGQLADISFTAVAPTRGATTTVDGLQLISSSPAQGGLYGGSYPVTGTWSAADLGLDPTRPQHVKVSVESVNADGSAVPGGAKSKVFWLEPCAPAVEPAVQPVAVASTGGAPVFGPRAVLPRPVPAAAPETAVLAGSVSAQSVSPSAVVAAPTSLVQPFVLPPVSARASTPPAQLPFTGSPELLALLLGGVVTLAGGSALLVAVRRAA